jgi:hypothetical protein
VTDRLVTAAELAVVLGVSRAFVYDNAEQLGVIRLGSGRKPRLRFDAAIALAAFPAAPALPEPSRPFPRRSRRRSSTAGSILRVRPAENLNNKRGGSRG